MDVTPAKKGTGLQGVIESLTPGVIEEIRKTSPAAADQFGPLLAKLNIFLDRNLPFWPEEHEDQEVPDLVREVLTPRELDAFLQASLLYENKPNFYSNTGIFISKLITNSYHTKYKSFILHANSLLRPLEDIGIYVKGLRKSPPSIVIHGNVGDYFGFLSENVRYTLHGDVEGDNCARSADNCTFTFYGGIKGDDFSLGAENSIFKATPEETVELLVEQVPSGNKIIQLLPNKRQRIVRDYHQ